MNRISRLMLMLAVIISIAFFSNCGGSSKSVTEDGGEQKNDIEQGEALFQGQVKAEVDCASCHDGDTGQAPDLANVVNGLSDEEILKAMEEGKGSMPAFSEMLLEKEQQQILSCLRARFNSGEEDAPAGEEVAPTGEQDVAADTEEAAQ